MDEAARQRYRSAPLFAGLLVLAAASHARAHGDPPQVLSIVATDADGAVEIVRLNEGLAVREAGGDSFRYVCPALWGEDAVAPADSIPGGPAIVGASDGLLLLQDGALVPHPDPRARGRVIALSSSAAGLFALLQAGDLHVVLRVEARAVQVLWSGTEPLHDLAAGADFVHAVRLAAGELVALRLSTEGEVLARDVARAPDDGVAVLARAAGSTAYAVLLTSTLEAELGRIEDGAWHTLVRAPSIAGPIETEDGARYVAVGGRLAAFDGDERMQLPETAAITCLRLRLELGYACTVTDVRALVAGELGAPLFSLQQLVAPELASLPEAQRAMCDLQWQRYAVDLRAIGIESGAGALLDAGASFGDAAVAGPDAGSADAAGGGARERDASGCGVVRGAGEHAAAPGWVLLAALLACALRALSIRRLRTDRPRPCRRRRTS